MKFEIFRSSTRKPVLTTPLGAAVLGDARTKKIKPSATPDFSHLVPRAGTAALPDVPFGHLVGPRPETPQNRPENSPAQRAIHIYNRLVGKN